MPSFLHDGLLQLVRDRPDFAAELVRDILHVEVPDFTSARVAEAGLNELVPTEYSSDLVVLLEQDKPVFGIVHEAQLELKKRKRFTWPVYGTSLRARLECPVVVVVIATDDATARWAAKPIPLGGQSVYVPLVIGPKGVPIVTDPELAVADPELAVLSVMAHGRDEESVAVAVARAATLGIQGFDRDRWVLYSALIESSLSDAAKAHGSGDTRANAGRQRRCGRTLTVLFASAKAAPDDSGWAAIASSRAWAIASCASKPRSSCRTSRRRWRSCRPRSTKRPES